MTSYRATAQNCIGFMFTGTIFGPIFTPQGVVGEPDKGKSPFSKVKT